MRIRSAIPALFCAAAMFAAACSGCDNESGKIGENNSGETNNGETNNGETNNGETNNGETNNGECIPHAAAELCATAGAECGIASLEDNCGDTRDVDCGSCAEGAPCGADNLCECVDTAADICARLMKDCGTLDVTDECGEERTVDCGSCMDDEECGADNVCSCPCTIDGQCIPDGMLNSANTCQICDPATADDDWTALAAGSACDDGQACTTGTTCDASAACTGGSLIADTCLIDGTCYVAGASGARECRLCDPDTSTDVWTNTAAGTTCDDNLACTSGDACDGEGACVPAGITAGTCSIDAACYNQGDLNPNNPCEMCDPAADQEDWSNVDLGTACDDGLACTSGGSCDGGGECVGVIAVDTCAIDGVCYNDGDADPNISCRLCDSDIQQNQWSAADVGTACDDGYVCTVNDVCDGTGNCAGEIAADACLIRGQCYVADEVNPNRLCTYCEPTQDNDDWSFLPAGTVCDDELACTGDGTCNPGGNCRTGTPMAGTCAIDDACYSDGDINPANPCESCQSALENTNWSPRTGAVCDDGLACTSNDVCNVDSECQGTVDAGFCVVDNACHTDGATHPTNECETCDANADQTAWSLNDGVACEDGDGLDCTGVCVDGACVDDLLDPDSCAIDDACYASGDANPMNECQVCDPATDPLGWTSQADDTMCGAAGTNICCAGQCLGFAACP